MCISDAELKLLSQIAELALVRHFQDTGLRHDLRLTCLTTILIPRRYQRADNTPRLIRLTSPKLLWYEQLLFVKVFTGMSSPGDLQLGATPARPPRRSQRCKDVSVAFYDIYHILSCVSLLTVFVRVPYRDPDTRLRAANPSIRP
ncbi:hypothetical protein J6590_008175 [Homalodisca vitripennis]|nr:hypothetical protein J6590_008175 [Homalodisca vitripennis]